MQTELNITNEMKQKLEIAGLLLVSTHSKTSMDRQFCFESYSATLFTEIKGFMTFSENEKDFFFIRHFELDDFSNEVEAATTRING